MSSLEKRKRSHEDDFTDFVPLSKRINNLHIDNNNITGFTAQDPHLHHQQQHQQIHQQQQHQESQLLLAHKVHTDDNSLPESVSSIESGGGGGFEMNLGNYNPDLNADENPYYYTKNKLLYDLYVERMRRCSLLSY